VALLVGVLLYLLFRRSGSEAREESK